MLNNMFCCVLLVSLISVILFGVEYLYSVIKNKPNNDSRKVLIISVIVLAISFVGVGMTMGDIEEPTDVETKVEEEVEPKEDVKVEPKEDVEVEEEEDVVVEPKEETEEDVDTYVNNNPNPSYNDNSMEEVDSIVEEVLFSSYPSSNYDVALESDENTVAIAIVSKDLNVNGISQSELDYMLEQYDLPSIYDNLAETVKEVYAQYGFNVSVGIGIYDVNGNQVYVAYAY